MKSTAFGAAVLFALAQSVVGLQINTPTNVVECQPVLLSWSSDAGTPPYYVSVIPGGQPSAPALKTFPPMQDTSFTWKVDLQAGLEVTISLKDGTGVQAYTDKFMIQDGGDRSCEQGLNGTPSASGSSTPTPAASSPASTSGSTPAASGSSTSAAASGSARPTGSQAAVASSRPTSGAIRTTAFTGGFAGFLAIVGALVY